MPLFPRILALIALAPAGMLLAQPLPPLGRALFIGVNLLALFAFGWDKLKAQSGGTRIPEWALCALALGAGVAGASWGRVLFRHKTQKLTFSLVNLLGIAVVLCLLRLVGA